MSSMPHDDDLQFLLKVHVLCGLIHYPVPKGLTYVFLAVGEAIADRHSSEHPELCHTLLSLC